MTIPAREIMQPDVSGSTYHLSAHGPGVMFFRIAVQSVRTLLIAADKDAVIQHAISQPLRILMRLLIQLRPISPRSPGRFLPPAL